MTFTNHILAFRTFIGVVTFLSIIGSGSPTYAISGFIQKIKTTFKAEEVSTTATNAQTIDVLKPTPLSTSDIVAAQSKAEEVLEAKVGSMRLSNEDIDFPIDDTISVYEIKKGDTLSSVAKLFNVSKNTIAWANDIDASKALVPGKTLVILPVTGIRHTVKKGDTIASIAKRYKGDLNDIIRYNGISKDSSLAVGSILIVPDGEIIGAPKTTSPLVRKLATAPVGFFVRPMKVYTRTQPIHGNNAVDLAAPRGSQVVSVASGRVLIARQGGYNGGYGSMIVIAHENKIQTLYAHLASVSVTPGQAVEQGQIIGVQGNSGRSTGPHLHFEVRGAANPF